MIALESQRRASDPTASTWLTANAGSGKTSVLTDRVARLLLIGTDPQRILCLTYTKAAAGEMQNRLFKRLGEWAMLPDAGLRTALAGIATEPDLTEGALRRARRLFATALETPGGIRIQTIHAFCAGLLRRFPLEAGVTPAFRELDEMETKALRLAIAEEIAEGADRDALSAIARELTSDDGFATLLDTIAKRAEAFDPARSRQDIFRDFGVDPTLTAETLLAQVLGNAGKDLIETLVPILQAAGGNDAKAAQKLKPLLSDAGAPAGLSALESVLLYGEKAASPYGAKRDEFPRGDTRKGPAAHLMEELDALMLRVETARETRLALAAADRCDRLHRFAEVYLRTYQRHKVARGLLDFDDLIRHTDRLLSDRATADWVLYRLDGGIDHILVDEAQDTSPAQWRVVEKLAAEFTAGASARPVRRTIFVVGDPKQSIYSFQGADVENFGRVRNSFGARLDAIGERLFDGRLVESFRSSAAILNVVDATFSRRETRGWDDPPRHVAFHSDKPGRVDLWDAIPNADKDDDVAPDTLDHSTGAPGAKRLLAEAIAREIRRLIDVGTRVPTRDGTGSKPLSEGDVMVLVRRRGELFFEIIRACKSAGLAVAGADRLKLAAETAVQDLRALLEFLALPEDNLALAGLLKSPLVGLSERQLYDLAATRSERYLWAALRQRRSDFPQAVDMLTDLRDQSDYLRPYDLLERMLHRHGGRQRILDRLGAEAEEGIDGLLAQALAYETTEAPTVMGFLARLGDDTSDVKRQPDAASRQLRVMTVHGAKGLEAPLVILPDTCGTGAQTRDPVGRTDGGLPIWRANKPEAGRLQRQADAADAARQQEERRRVLYVAMTRAESWLIVAGHGKADGECWHAQVRAGMQAAGATRLDSPPQGISSGLRYEFGTWPEGTRGAVEDAPTQAPAPAWLEAPAAAPAPPAGPLSPSALGGAKVLPGDPAQADEAGRVYGTALHRLLELFPACPVERRTSLATSVAASVALAEGAPAPDTRTLLADAGRILGDPLIAGLLARGAMSEVEISGTLKGAEVRGAVDLLLVEPDAVTIVDYKSNVLVPDVADKVPAGILRQLGAYVAILEQAYPGREVRPVLFWTRAGRSMPVPCDMVRAALHLATIP